jgi:hypothetical protein
MSTLALRIRCLLLRRVKLQPQPKPSSTKRLLSPALTRADIGRLTAAAASAIGNPGYTGEELEKLPEVIARAFGDSTGADLESVYRCHRADWEIFP